MFLRQINWFKKQNWRELIAGASSILFGVLTFILLIMDRSASAAVSAAMTGASVFALILPIVDTIEAFGLKAKLVRQIDEGEQLLVKLRETVSVLAKPIFSSSIWQQMGWHSN